MNEKNAAPAPEPVAWAVIDHGDGQPWHVTTCLESARIEAEQNDDTVIPLYAHPAPVAAPDAATVDQIMALALEFRNAERFKEISDSALALRAAVERLVKELADVREMDSRAFASWQKERDKLQERAERAERETITANAAARDANEAARRAEAEAAALLSTLKWLDRWLGDKPMMECAKRVRNAIDAARNK